MKSKSYNKQILERYGLKPVAYINALAKVAQSATAGLFLSQLLYWWDKGHYSGWVYKTIEDMYEEISLTRSQQDRAIKIWKALGVIEVVKRQVPAKRHFKINIEKLLSILDEQLLDPTVSITKNAGQFAGLDKLDSYNKQTITETPTKTIQKNTPDISLNKRGVDEIDTEMEILNDNFYLDNKTRTVKLKPP